MGLTELEMKEIENFTKAAPTLFTGLIMDESAQGRANANSVISHLYGQGLPISVANLDAVVIELQHTLFWSPGDEPVRDTRAPRGTNNGVPRYEGTQYTDRANGIVSEWTKEIRAGQAANAARFAAKAKADIRFRETHQQLVGPDGRVSHAQSEAANKIAAARHAQEDAIESGRPITVATGPRSIPSSETDPNYQAWLRTASADEIKTYLSRKGRSHLMR